MSPRAAALAGSFVAADDDANVIFYNPAGLNLLEGQPVSVSYVSHLLDINYMGAVYSREFKGIGRFAAGVSYINYGSFAETDEFGNRTGDFRAGDLLLTLGYAGAVSENFYYGANIKFIYSSIAEYSSTGIAFDLGLNYQIPDKMWSFGISVLNAGSQLTSYAGKREELPLDVRLGVSKSLAHTPFRFFLSLNKLNGDYETFSDRFNQFTVGAEISLGKTVKLRIGYDNERRRELKIGSTTGLAGISVGFGFKVSSYKVDYSYSSMGSIGSMNRFGISTAL